MKFLGINFKTKPDEPLKPAERPVTDVGDEYVDTTPKTAPAPQPDPALLAAHDAARAEDEHHDCIEAPRGWQCTRPAGHEGPCAAVLSGEPVSTVQFPELLLEQMEARGFRPDQTAELRAHLEHTKHTPGEILYGDRDPALGLSAYSETVQAGHKSLQDSLMEQARKAGR